VNFPLRSLTIAVYPLLVTTLPLLAEDTFPNLGRYISDLTLQTPSKGAGTSARLRNEAGTLFDSHADNFSSNYDPRSHASDITWENSTYGLVNRSQGMLSTALSIKKVRISEREDSTSSLNVRNHATQTDWLIFRDQRDLEDSTTPFELTVVYSAQFNPGNVGTADPGTQSFSVDFVLGDDDEDQLIEHSASHSVRNTQPAEREGFGTFRETFTLLPGERFRISTTSTGEVTVAFRLIDDTTQTNGVSRIIAGGGFLNWKIRLEAPDYIVQSASKSGHQWLSQQIAPRSGAPVAPVERFTPEPGQRELQVTTSPGGFYRAFMSPDLTASEPLGFPIEAEEESTTFPLPEEAFAAERGFFWIEEVSPGGE